MKLWSRALTDLDIEGVADLVDPGSLREQVELITRQRDAAIFALPDAARRGELREVPVKTLTVTSMCRDPAVRAPDWVSPWCLLET